MSICPYCKWVLSEEELYDFTEYDEKVILYYKGGCPTCGREFKWSRTFYWDQCIYDLEELE